MVNRLTLSTTEKIFFCLLLTFPLVDYILRNWITFGGGIWDKGVLVVLLLFAFINKLATEREQSHLKGPFIAFILFGATLLVLSMPTFAISFEGFRSIYQFMVAFFIGYYLLNNEADLTFALRVVMGTGAIIALYGLAQPYLGVQMPAGWVDAGESQRFRAFSIVQSPNVLGSFMAFLIPIGASLVFAEKKRMWKLLWTVVTLVLLACLLATLSRGAWVAFAAAITFFVILIDRRALFAVIIAGLLVLFFVPEVTDRFTFLLSGTYMEKSSQDGRIARWGGALDQARSQPLYGRGLGHYGGAVAERNLGVTYVDNYYAKTLAETGLVGLTVFIWLLFATLKKGYDQIRKTTDPPRRWLMRGILAGLVAVIVHNAVENIFEVPFMTTYFWLFAGILLAVPFLTNKEVSEIE